MVARIQARPLGRQLPVDEWPRNPRNRFWFPVEWLQGSGSTSFGWSL